MKIELKNIKHYASMSEETNCYEAVLYIDGKAVASVCNRGTGGETNIVPTPQGRAMVLEAQKYCTTLPPYKSGEFSIDMNLEMLCDDLLDAWLRQKETKRINNMLNKKSKDYYVLLMPDVMEAIKSGTISEDFRYSMVSRMVDVNKIELKGRVIW